MSNKFRVVVSDQATGWNWATESEHFTLRAAVGQANQLLASRFFRVRNPNAACRVMLGRDVVWLPVVK